MVASDCFLYAAPKVMACYAFSAVIRTPQTCIQHTVHIVDFRDVVQVKSAVPLNSSTTCLIGLQLALADL